MSSTEHEEGRGVYRLRDDVMFFLPLDAYIGVMVSIRYECYECVSACMYIHTYTNTALHVLLMV